MRTFIVRLRQEASGMPGAARPRLCGVVDEVATGMRTTFRDDHELVTALTTALRAAGEPSPDTPDSILGESQHVAD